MIDPQNIQWFPGHMAKTRRMMAENLKMVDIVVEITDARIPKSSRNPEIDRIVGDKPRLILLNKCDSADDNITKRWMDYYAAGALPLWPPTVKAVKGWDSFRRRPGRSSRMRWPAVRPKGCLPGPFA